MQLTLAIDTTIIRNSLTVKKTSVIYRDWGDQRGKANLSKVNELWNQWILRFWWGTWMIEDQSSITSYVFQSDIMEYQKTTHRALSTNEAKYMSLSVAVQEALWLRSLHAENPNTCSEARIYNNKSVIDLSMNDYYRARSKHRHLTPFYSWTSLRAV